MVGGVPAWLYGVTMVWVGEGLELELVSIVFAVQAPSMYRPALMQLFAAPCCNTHYAWLFKLAPDPDVMINLAMQLLGCGVVVKQLKVLAVSKFGENKGSGIDYSVLNHCTENSTTPNVLYVCFCFLFSNSEPPVPSC